MENTKEFLDEIIKPLLEQLHTKALRENTIYLVKLTMIEERLIIIIMEKHSEVKPYRLEEIGEIDSIKLYTIDQKKEILKNLNEWLAMRNWQ